MTANRRRRGASHSSVRRIVLPVCVILAAACTLVLTQAGLSAPPPVPDAPIAGNTTGFLSECIPLPDARKARCYVRGLLHEVERSPNPATGVPAIDGKVHDAGGFLEAACHSLMHEVGRTWARERDYRTMLTDWRVTNLLSSRFWPRRGFHPSFLRLHRLIA